MVSVLDSGSSDPGLSPGQGTTLCSWARHCTLILPLFTRVYNVEGNAVKYYNLGQNQLRQMDITHFFAI